MTDPSRFVRIYHDPSGEDHSQSDLEEFGNVPVIFIPGDDEDFFTEHQV